jgi:hypothetical protein
MAGWAGEKLGCGECGHVIKVKASGGSKISAPLCCGVPMKMAPKAAKKAEKPKKAAAKPKAKAKKK